MRPRPPHSPDGWLSLARPGDLINIFEDDVALWRPAVLRAFDADRSRVVCIVREDDILTELKKLGRRQCAGMEEIEGFDTLEVKAACSRPHWDSEVKLVAGEVQFIRWFAAKTTGVESIDMTPRSAAALQPAAPAAPKEKVAPKPKAAAA